jgi:hypothetical protein
LYFFKRAIVDFSCPSQEQPRFFVHNLFFFLV